MALWPEGIWQCFESVVFGGVKHTTAGSVERTAYAIYDKIDGGSLSFVVEIRSVWPQIEKYHLNSHGFAILYAVE